MSQGHRHGSLKMGVAGHEGLFFSQGNPGQGVDESIPRLDRLQDCVAQVESEIGGHLVVPGTSGMELASQGSDDLG